MMVLYSPSSSSLKSYNEVEGDEGEAVVEGMAAATELVYLPALRGTTKQIGKESCAATCI